MNIDRKSLISIACGTVLTAGLIVTLVMITMFIPGDILSSFHENAPYFIFFFSLLVVMPLISRRLKRLDNINKMVGWTFVGLGAELTVFPVPLLILILKFPSIEGLFVGGLIITYSVVFGVPAGLISIAIGIFITKQKSNRVLHQ